jgi:hypothetical protein
MELARAIYLFAAPIRNIEGETYRHRSDRMELAKLNVMYGHLEGTDGKFARDPSGYLSIDTGM